MRQVDAINRLTDEIRDRAPLLPRQLMQTGVGAIIEIELRSHHAMYIHHAARMVKFGRPLVTPWRRAQSGPPSRHLRGTPSPPLRSGSADESEH